MYNKENNNRKTFSLSMSTQRLNYIFFFIFGDVFIFKLQMTLSDIIKNNYSLQKSKKNKKNKKNT